MKNIVGDDDDVLDSGREAGFDELPVQAGRRRKNPVVPVGNGLPMLKDEILDFLGEEGGDRFYRMTG
jgi:hypothetical protein